MLCYDSPILILALLLKSVHLLVYWILFETVMAMHRSKGTFIGLLETDRVNKWVVTEKLGDALLKSKSSEKNLPIKPSEKPPLLESFGVNLDLLTPDFGINLA